MDSLSPQKKLSLMLALHPNGPQTDEEAMQAAQRLVGLADILMEAEKEQRMMEEAHEN